MGYDAAEAGLGGEVYGGSGPLWPPRTFRSWSRFIVPFRPGVDSYTMEVLWFR